MDAMQVLPALASLLGCAAAGEGRRRGLVWAGTTGYGALVAVSLLQPAAGLAPLGPRRGRRGAVPAGVPLLGTAFTAAPLALRQPTRASA